jgi:hypothetical protein
MPSATVLTKTSLPKTIAGKGPTIAGKLWRVLKIIYLIALIGLVAVQSGVESIKEKSPFPFLYHIGGKVLSPDEQNYQLLKQMETEGITVSSEDDWFETVKTSFKKGGVWYAIIVNLGSIFALGFVIYLFWNMWDNTSKVKTIGRVLLSLVLLQILLAGILYPINILEEIGEGKTINEVLPNYDTMSPYQRGIEIGKNYIPFKGTGLLIYKVVKKISDPSFVIIKETIIPAQE